MTKGSVFTVTLIILLISGPLKAEHPKNMREAKKFARQIWADNRVSFYCGCAFDRQLKVNLNSCSYQAEGKNNEYRIHWEHIVPVSHFGQQRACWRDGCETKNGKIIKGRQCCEKVDPEFRKMSTDLHNLVPAIGSVNRARSNFRFAELSSSHKQKIGHFRNCPIFISKGLRKVEPNDRVKGAVARTYLYFNKQYNYQLGSGQERLFSAWVKKYPMEEWELHWRKKVDETQDIEKFNSY